MLEGKNNWKTFHTFRQVEQTIVDVHTHIESRSKYASCNCSSYRYAPEKRSSIAGKHWRAEKSWAKYFLSKMNYVKRKATTKARFAFSNQKPVFAGH